MGINTGVGGVGQQMRRRLSRYRGVDGADTDDGGDDGGAGASGGGSGGARENPSPYENPVTRGIVTEAAEASKLRRAGKGGAERLDES